jgi:hypothetical protein
VDGVDEFGVVDGLEVDRGDPRLLCPSWRWITTRGTPSWAISTAWACRSWCGAKRRRKPALAAVRRIGLASMQQRSLVLPVFRRRREAAAASRDRAPRAAPCLLPGLVLD